MMFHIPQKQVSELKISINNSNMDRADSLNFLGLTLDANLKWNCHNYTKNC